MQESPGTWKHFDRTQLLTRVLPVLVQVCEQDIFRGALHTIPVKCSYLVNGSLVGYWANALALFGLGSIRYNNGSLLFRLKVIPELSSKSVRNINKCDYFEHYFP